MKNFVLMLFGVVVGFSTVAIVASRQDKLPLTVVGVSTCDVDQGAVVSFGDGRTEFFQPRDPELLAILKQVPEKSKGRLYTQRKLCPSERPQVY